MDQKLLVYFVDGKRFSGPFLTFEAAFSHITKHQKDARIETEEGQVLATWSLWTGLHRVNASYKYRVVNSEFNKKLAPHLIGKVLDRAPQGLMVQEVEA